MIGISTRAFAPTAQLLAGSTRLPLSFSPLSLATPEPREITELPKRQLAYRRKDKGLSSSPERTKKPVGVHKSENLHAASNIKETLNSYKAQLAADVEQSAAAANDEVSPFRYDSTFTLLKKFFIYKMMSSNFFINYSLLGMNLSYKLFGITLTNTVIEKTAGSIFTGGVTLDDLNRDIKVLEERQIGGIGCYVVEGVRDPKDSELDAFTDFTMESIKHLSENGSEGHFALKLTAFIGLEALERVSLAQKRFTEDILKVDFNVNNSHVQLTKAELRQNLSQFGIDDFKR